MRLRDGARLRLGNAGDAHRSGSLIDRIMNGTDKRISDSRSSNRAVVASISVNLASFVNGELGFFLASSSTTRAAAVLPTPGGPYTITCCGFELHSAALSAFNPSRCPTMSFSVVGLVFSANGFVNEIERSLFSLSISFFDSRSTAVRLPFWLRSRFQKYIPITTAKTR